jgi:endoglucanase
MPESPGIATELGELIAALAGLDGPPGREASVVAWLQARLVALVDQIGIDRMGNLTAIKGGDRSGPTLLVCAHADEIGAMVTAIEADGKLRFAPAGGLVESLLVGRRVRVSGMPGVIGVKAGHLQGPEERLRAPHMADLYVDLGYDTRHEVEAQGIRPGATIVYDSPLQPLANSNRLCGKALDNRVNCAILVKLLERVAPVDLGGTLVCAATVQEEVGMRGAGVLAERLRPDYAIVLDTIPAGDTPELRLTRDANVRLGGGPVLRLMSGDSYRGHLVPPQILRVLRQAAADAKVEVQEVVLASADTDAAMVQLAGGGIPTGTINLPRRYAHSPVEVIDLDDVVQTLRLTEALVRGIGNHDLDFTREAF